MTEKNNNAKEKVISKTHEDKEQKVFSLKGVYTEAVGRRKSAIARVRVYKNGKGLFMVNGSKLSDYFDESSAALAEQPLKLMESIDLDVSVFVSGGGVRAQAEAVRHGLSRVLVITDSEAKGLVKSKGWLTRDSRKKERKKPGLKKARKSPQWSKR